MKLQHIELKKLEIPFHVAFKHTSATRTTTETVIAVAHSDNNIIGYGEGCPRSYVTGESIASCMDFAAAHHQSILTINNIQALRTFVAANQSAIDKNPAAWCAIETAILDLLGKLKDTSIEAVMGLPEIEKVFNYTAVLGISNPNIFSTHLKQHIQNGFNDFKIKISGDFSSDTANIAAIRAARPEAKIRLDANNLWNDVEEATSYLKSLPPKFWAIEEPIIVRDYDGLKILANRLSCKIILDESFLNVKDFKHLSADSDIWIPNIRISKMGGLIRSIDVAKECRNLNMRFIIGAQVGETSLLTRTALSLANAYRDVLIGQEGAYGTLLLQYDITERPLMFGKNGVMKWNTNGTGLGLHIEQIALGK